jgi:hypothetical protein
MILVHDVDLARISGICDSNVNNHHMIFESSCSLRQSLETLKPDVVENYLQGSNTEVYTDLFRKHLLVSRFLPCSQKVHKKVYRLPTMTTLKSSEWQSFP